MGGPEGSVSRHSAGPRGNLDKKKSFNSEECTKTVSDPPAVLVPSSLLPAARDQ